jgi:hypothetical protein
MMSTNKLWLRSWGSGLRVLLAAVVVGCLSGCASTEVDARWRSAELAPHYLRAARVMVVCETPEVVLKRICQDQVSAELLPLGVEVVYPPEALAVPYAQSEVDPQLVDAARSAGAKAVFDVVLGISARTVSPGMAISIGGFGFGGGGGGAGVGVSAPIGGGKVSTGYSASARVSDAVSARLLWTARASTPPSGDLNAQMSELSKALVGEARNAGLF